MEQSNATMVAATDSFKKWFYLGFGILILFLFIITSVGYVGKNNIHSRLAEDA